MSTPPFIDIPDGVALFDAPPLPVPVLLATPVTRDAGATDGAQGTVLLVPGFTGSKEDFIAILAPLAERGWRVAAMDLPGQGGAPALGPRGSHTTETLARVVLAVADWLSPGQPVHLVGHSMGGLVTRSLVIAHSDRIRSWIPMCSGPGPIPEAKFTDLTGLQAAVAHLPMDQVWVHKEALDRAGGWTPPSAEVAEFCARRFIANDPAALADFADILMTEPDHSTDAAAVVRSCGIGGAVLTGALDDVWPLPEQERMAHQLGVPWVVIPDVGHNPGTEAPAATVEVLDRVFRGAR